jgi:hypothetical protein
LIEFLPNVLHNLTELTGKLTLQLHRQNKNEFAWNKPVVEMTKCGVPRAAHGFARVCLRIWMHRPVRRNMGIQNDWDDLG